MIHLTIDGLNISVEQGATLLDAARLYGIPIPTICSMEGLSPYGACRLCVVQISEEKNTKLVSSCTYLAQDGQNVITDSPRVIRARKMILELLLASCPQSRIIQDLASEHDIYGHRFKQEFEDCFLCGLCVRMCEEQMMAGAIDFKGRGETRSIGTPFNMKSDACRTCGGCIYICPACQLSGSDTDLKKAPLNERSETSLDSV